MLLTFISAHPHGSRNFVSQKSDSNDSRGELFVDLLSGLGDAVPQILDIRWSLVD